MDTTPPTTAIIIALVFLLLQIIQILILYRIVSLLNQIHTQVQQIREENRTLLRTIISNIQEVSRSLAIELREEFNKSRR